MSAIEDIVVEALTAAEQAQHRWMRSYTTKPPPPKPAEAALAGLAAPENREALVAWLVEVGVLEEAADASCGAPFWFADGEVVMVDEYGGELPEGALPLYRVAGLREADRA